MKIFLIKKDNYGKFNREFESILIQQNYEIVNQVALADKVYDIRLFSIEKNTEELLDLWNSFKFQNRSRKSYEKAIKMIQSEDINSRTLGLKIIQNQKIYTDEIDNELEIFYKTINHSDNNADPRSQIMSSLIIYENCK